MERKPNTQYVASISYGKDSLAMLEAINLLGYPLDRIVTAEVWATDDIQADLPPMVEFKDKADKIIKERYGIDVEHFCAMTTKEKKYCANFQQPPKIVGGYKYTYQDMFYQVLEKGNHIGSYKGFPQTIGSWCKKLKDFAVKQCQTDVRKCVLPSLQEQGARISNSKRKLVQLNFENGRDTESLFNKAPKRIGG